MSAEYVGVQRDSLDKTKIVAATFHPFRPEWYVIYKDGERILFLTITSRVCTSAEVLASAEAGFSRMLHLREVTNSLTPMRVPKAGQSPLEQPAVPWMVIRAEVDPDNCNPSSRIPELMLIAHGPFSSREEAHTWGEANVDRSKVDWYVIQITKPF